MSLLITLEGLDGTGKSSLIKALPSDSFNGQWVYKVKEPGITVNSDSYMPFNRPGIDLRSIVLNDRTLTPFERELLFYVDASQNRRFIENQRSALVFSDRGYWSHLAYLRATLKIGKIDNDQYVLGKDLINLFCAKPDRVIYLRGSIELMQERLKDKPKDAIESNKVEFFKYVLETYEDLAFENNECLILDAKDTIVQNTEKVLSYLEEAFNNEDFRRKAE